jgi:hypothetical protein
MNILSWVLSKIENTNYTFPPNTKLKFFKKAIC